MRALVLAALIGLAACSGGNGEAGRPGAAPAAEPPPAGDPPPAAKPAAATASPTGAPSFDADSAWVRLVKQVEFGPRVPGTAAHRACGDWLAAELERAGGRVDRDPFTYRDGEGVTWPLVNIRGRFGPPGGGRLLLVAHWDTRPWADLDPDPARRDQPIPGANDGASGVAVLLEIARCLGATAPPGGVDILFTDGEDLGRAGNEEGFARGAMRFAGRGLSDYRRALVVDMVGDADLRLPVEGNSLTGAPEVVDWVWARGLELAPQVFTTELGRFVYDDHVPLLEAGLPTADLIDFDYPYWHTHRDDLDAVSAASLDAVGRVLVSLIYSP